MSPFRSVRHLIVLAVAPLAVVAAAAVPASSGAASVESRADGGISTTTTLAPVTITVVGGIHTLGVPTCC